MEGLMMNYPLTLDRIVEHANRSYPRKRVATKLPDGTEHSYTFAEFYRRVKRLAKALTALGVEPGDRVGTFSFNTYQHLELYFAVPGAGAVCHTLNIRLSSEQLAYIINHAEDKVVFIDGPLLPVFEKLAGHIDGVRQFVVFNAPAGVASKLPNVIAYEDLIAGTDEDYEWRCTDENMAMGLCYTSGTTGHPKGVLYSHRSMFLHTLGEVNANVLGLRETDVVMPVVPQFHAMAWGLPYACVLNGSEIVMPGMHLQPAALAELIATHRVTIAAGVPTIWNALYHELKNNPCDLSSIRSLVVGGSAMPRSLIEAYETQLKVNVLHAWGMTELSPLGSVSVLQSQHLELTPQQKFDIKAMQGYAVPGVEMRLVDDAGAIVVWDGATMGELQVRGPWVARSYFKTPPGPDHFTADGWFRTGDVATISPDGYMNIVDRTKDLIKSGGEWISSVALENALLAHPKIMEAVVIAVPDEKWVERPLAYIVPTADAGEISQDELREHLAGEFARWQLPDQFIVVSAIPKTSVGKLDKKALRKSYSEARG